MAEARAIWRSRWYDRTGAALYDFAVEREPLARVLGLIGTPAARARSAHLDTALAAGTAQEKAHRARTVD
jgi:hypothetical protein